MRIDGHAISKEIIYTLQERIRLLSRKGIIPHLAVILVGDDPSSHTYVRRKEVIGKEIGANVSVYKLSALTSKQELMDLINCLNADSSIHGIIIQRPVPIEVSKEALDCAVVKEKDVDGYRADSPFNPPIAEAVLKILVWVHLQKKTHEGSTLARVEPFWDWLKKKRILIIGRGETGGKPIAYTFEKKGIPFTVAHSKTENLKSKCLQSDIIVSCVGKGNIVRRDMVTKITVLIGVGLHPEDERLKPDYDQLDIASKIAYHTPVPGGVGPVNVACLFDNLLKSRI